jgi:hypothetical protein
VSDLTFHGIAEYFSIQITLVGCVVAAVEVILNNQIRKFKI